MSEAHFSQLAATREARGIGARTWLLPLASLKLTLAVLVLLAFAVLGYYFGVASSVWALVVPLALFAVNLGAAVIANPVFRRQTALLAFHLALLAIVVLVAAGRLTYLRGQLELAEGEAFAGRLTGAEAGPWHWWRLDRVAFVNEGFMIRYERDVRRAETRNHVRWIDDSGKPHLAVIGDNDPLVLHGYRFYTTFNKGFAPTFIWYPKDGGAPQRGTINLPSYPIHEYGQALEWTPPGSARQLWTMLVFDETILDPEKPSQFRTPRAHRLVIRDGGERRELKPGDRCELADGVLVYEGLRTWMGYTVFSDWTLPWLLAACLFAAASLAWHFWKKFAAQPWEG